MARRGKNNFIDASASITRFPPLPLFFFFSTFTSKSGLEIDGDASTCVIVRPHRSPWTITRAITSWQNWRKILVRSFVGTSNRLDNFRKLFFFFFEKHRRKRMDDEGLVNYFNPCDLKIGVEKDVPAWWYHVEGERKKKEKNQKRWSMAWTMAKRNKKGCMPVLGDRYL